MYNPTKENGLYLIYKKFSCEAILLKYNMKLKIQYLETNKTTNSEVLILWFQVILTLRGTPSFGGHNGVKTKGENIYNILIYSNERISIQP